MFWGRRSTKSVFYFPDAERIIIVKKINVEILMNVHVLRSEESKKVLLFFFIFEL